MNNEEFRKLVKQTSTTRTENASTDSQKSSNVLGTRSRPAMYMTPRAVQASSGYRGPSQSAEGKPNTQSAKKFKSYVPRGVKLAKGYKDRTQDRRDDEDDDKEQRINALEEQMKLGQLDRTTFERLRDEIVGGDIDSTHLVKGLDFRLLERVRRGEDVWTETPKAKDGANQEDEDEEFETLEKKEILPERREQREKKGELAPAPVAGRKRTRDEILAQFKASRKKAQQTGPAAVQLGSKFKKVGINQEDTRIEIDERGREVLIVTDADGNVKRKVRKTRGNSSVQDLPMPDKDAKPLGMEAPSLPPVPAEESDDDIYAGIEDDYNPLGDLGEDDSSSDDEGPANPELDRKPKERPKEKAESDRSEDEQPNLQVQNPSKPSASVPRNYFNDDLSSISVLANMSNPLKDPSILAALSEKSRQKEADEGPARQEDDERLKKRAAMLASADRDMEDMDMGFGASRFDDAEDGDGGRIKLSEWNGGDDDGDEGGHGKGEKGSRQRKRGPKKRKGDKNSAADVMRVIEGRSK
jgi:hypothetical protein